ncbi:MAG: BREX system Lon protease-like protein BrxL [Deltaproteobacteria bacterium]|nr:BREX system Lon protease-like protein BrxL [Deltaproteobacteria bacterium]
MPEQYYDSAFLDRLHFYIPGWEVDIIREMFSDGYGLSWIIWLKFCGPFAMMILTVHRTFPNFKRYLATGSRPGIENVCFPGLDTKLYPHGEATEKKRSRGATICHPGRKPGKCSLCASIRLRHGQFWL